MFAVSVAAAAAAVCASISASIVSRFFNASVAFSSAVFATFAISSTRVSAEVKAVYSSELSMSGSTAPSVTFTINGTLVRLLPLS